MLRTLRQEIDPDSHSQTTDYEGGWSVHEECADQGGRLVVTKMTIKPTTEVVPPGGINSRFLRGIQVGKMFEMFRQAILRNPGSGMEGALALFGPRKRRPRWARNDNRFYAELASDYVNVWTGKIPTLEGRDKPTEALAKLRGVRLTLLRSQIHLARKNGFLSGGRQGKAGGELTALAQQALTPKEAPSGRKKR